MTFTRHAVCPGMFPPFSQQSEPHDRLEAARVALIMLCYVMLCYVMLCYVMLWV